MTLDLLYLDADDTLWHNFRNFDAAEQAFFAMMAPFADDATARSHLERTSSANLQHYGYGAKSFTLTMIESAAELCGDRLDRQMIVDLLAAGRRLLAHPVELLDGVEDTLRGLAGTVQIVLVTKGDLMHQEAKIAASGVGDLFDGVEIVSDKTAATFSRLFERYGVKADRTGVVGDSIRSDILPALEAGSWAAHIPPPTGWAHESGVLPDRHPRLATLNRFADLPDWLRSLP